ncbi:hypothetical protein GMES_2175 [Paraglaciecola mesophila KMM 241]|uniref:Uncharacterized protein n=1 Tax=Paraglaciecola mesophila KMM 241 TaxID=1128912 RepID=K6YKE7_9ALTE|nr:hypothetical protein GMES_2175 [Paraglaciecola mesophila KMM 241]
MLSRYTKRRGENNSEQAIAFKFDVKHVNKYLSKHNENGRRVKWYQQQKMELY